MALTQKTTDIQQLQTQRIGYMAVSLTNYGNDSEPQLAEGSVLEIGGAVYEAEANESITGWGGISNDSDVYIKMNASTKGIEFTTTAPTWSTSKQGWYDSLDRYLFKLYKDASGNYAAKKPIPQHPDGTAAHGVEELTGSGNWTVPAGIKQVKATIVGAGGGAGGGGSTCTAGTAGGNTTFNGETALGGRGGPQSNSITDYAGIDTRNGLLSANGGGKPSPANEAFGDMADGEGGQIKIAIFDVTPGDSIAYSVGAGGAGGTGNVIAGGDGGDGIIILEY